MKYLKLPVMFCLWALLGVAHAATHTAKPGETLWGIATANKTDPIATCTATLAKGKVKECKLIQPGDVIHLAAKQDQKAKAQRSALEKFGISASATDVASIVRTAEKPLGCITLGVAPFNDANDLERLKKGIDELEKLSPAQKAKAKQLVESGQKLPFRILQKGEKYEEMIYWSPNQKKTVHMFDRAVCSAEEGGQNEAVDEWQIDETTILSVPRRCGNPGIRRVTPPIKEPETEKPKTPEKEKPVTTTPSDTPIVRVPDEPESPARKVRGKDYDAALFAGGDTSPVGFFGGIGAYYPVLTETSQGRLATGVGGFGSGWFGKNGDFGYDGLRGAIGLANKFSTPGGVDIGVKFPAWGKSWERGANTSGYEMKRTASLFCGAFDVTDARREKRGEEWAPEYLIYLQLCNAFGIKAEQSFQGKSLDPTPLKDFSGTVSVGGKFYYVKDLDTLFGTTTTWGKKLQPFVEIGADSSIPYSWSWHLYPIGVRTVDKVWGVGVGIHVTKGNIVPGGAVTYDIGRDNKLSIERARWTSMVKSLEALGVEVE